MTQLIVGLVIGLVALIIIFKMVSGEKSVGFDLLSGPLIIGILAGLFIYFVLPGTVARSDIVSRVTSFVVDLSNSYIENMPPHITAFIAQADLLKVAILAGIVITLVFQIFGIGKRTFIFLRYRIIHLLENMKRKKKLDLPTIDMDMEYRQEKKEEVIFSGRMNSIERD